jgi:lipoprotein-releasing system permease protein
MARQLADSLPAGLMVSDWTQSHANFFRAVKIEKTMMFVILSLIVAVAAFMVLSTLVMVVTDKESDIAILRTLGATPRSIMLIFITLGTIIGVLGTLLGLGLGVTLALNIENIMGFIERVFHFSLFPADVYYVSRLPAEIHTSDVVTVCCISFALTVLATIYPAWRAARTQPAEALRYE